MNPAHASCSDLIGVGVGIGIGIEGDGMSFGHERLDVYQAALEYVGQESIAMAMQMPTPWAEAEPRDCRTTRCTRPVLSGRRSVNATRYAAS
jgi:hypothetical protein